MRGLWGSAVVVVVLLGLVLCGAWPAGHTRPPSYRGKLIAGEWAWDFEGDTRGRIAAAHEFTGYAFGPGRTEIAFCSFDTPDSPSELWIVATAIEADEHEQTSIVSAARRRLLWRAPPGVTLRGPVWWAPNGSEIALRACSEESQDLVLVDYVTGEQHWLTQGATVVDMRWRWDAKGLAYVTEESTDRTVWLWEAEAGDPRSLGAGGSNLWWSVDGTELRWLRPDSDATWTQMIWYAKNGTLEEADRTPARVPESVWSPDGGWCASLVPAGTDEEKRLMIYRANAVEGEAVPLPGIPVSHLLGWSPDGAVVMVLAEDYEREDRLLAVNFQPIPDDVRHVVSSGRGALYSAGRATIIDWGRGDVDADAGPPTWSTSPTGLPMLCYATDESSRSLEDRDEDSESGKPEVLVAGTEARQYLGGHADIAAAVERAQLEHNLWGISMAFQMYLADNDDIFPPAADIAGARWILDEYVPAKTVFLRPGSEDEVCVRWLAEPGRRLMEVEDPVMYPIAAIDYPADYFLVSYADGSFQTWEGRPPAELRAPAGE
jgi:hypothetical protein